MWLACDRVQQCGEGASLHVDCQRLDSSPTVAGGEVRQYEDGYHMEGNEPAGEGLDCSRAPRMEANLHHFCANTPLTVRCPWLSQRMRSK